MTIHIFIGTEPKTEIPRKVLEHSIITQTTAKVEFHPMMGEGWTNRNNQAIKACGTGFSLLRWSIPEAMNYQGAAIYLDADIVCLGDIKDLYQVDVTYPNTATSTWCTFGKHKWFKDYETPETSVMLIDCEKAKTLQPNFKACCDYVQAGGRDRRNYMKLMRAQKHKVKPQEIPKKFNSLNVPQDDTLLLHYTVEPDQPWYSPTHEWAHIWEDALIAAIKDDYVTKEEVKAAIDDFTPHTKRERGKGMHPTWASIL